MPNQSKPFYRSKKFWAMVTGVVAIAGFYFMGLPHDLTMTAAGTISAYMLSQGMADSGKEAEAIAVESNRDYQNDNLIDQEDAATVESAESDTVVRDSVSDNPGGEAARRAEEMANGGHGTSGNSA